MDFTVTTGATQPEPPKVPCALVIFGVAGDLSRRKLLPSLFQLWRQGHLHPATSIVGVARREWGDDAFRDEVRECLSEFAAGFEVGSDEWASFAARLFFVALDLEDAQGFHRLASRLAALSTDGQRYVFYLSTPPDAIATVVDHIESAGLASSPEPGWHRIVVEKPFGHDLASSQALNARLLRAFREERVYRIDHYLGKESVQNLLVFRFGNTIYESIWNRRYVDHVQITVAETLGVETRGPFYESTGALRDIVQNHVIQLMATVAMEPPSSLDARHVRLEKVKVAEALRPIAAEDILRGQYIAGEHGEAPVPGYREESRVAPTSTTETYVAGKLFIDTWRWSGVPFYFRTGKRLPKRVTEVAIHFKEPPLALFRDCQGTPCRNVLAIRIQPNEGIALSFAAKTPGVSMDIATVEMDFRYDRAFRQPLSDAYETLLLDVIQGDSMLFAPAEMHDAAWRVLTPVLTAWAASSAGLAFYRAGTWGPAEADELLIRDGREWHSL
ncbi:glucose-6-phosphate dehydrogenase [Candidatus Poribacteria bacterium]|nr:glucose-6-phosphate dehydrogenase [Candidatus Poribacteria bacterium]